LVHAADYASLVRPLICPSGGIAKILSSFRRESISVFQNIESRLLSTHSASMEEGRIATVRPG
jgi:hypothetical protein